MKTTVTVAAIFPVIVALCACLAPLPASADGLNDILRPDYKKVYDLQEKHFGMHQFNLEKAFPFKAFPGEKTVEKNILPQRNFKSAPAAVGGRTFAETTAPVVDKAFAPKQWRNSKQYPTRLAPQSGRASPLGNKTVAQPTPDEFKKNLKQPPVMTEEEARQLIERLYGPFGGR